MVTTTSCARIKEKIKFVTTLDLIKVEYRPGDGLPKIKLLAKILIYLRNVS